MDSKATDPNEAPLSERELAREIGRGIADRAAVYVIWGVLVFLFVVMVIVIGGAATNP